MTGHEREQWKSSLAALHYGIISEIILINIEPDCFVLLSCYIFTLLGKTLCSVS